MTYREILISVVLSSQSVHHRHHEPGHILRPQPAASPQLQVNCCWSSPPTGRWKIHTVLWFHRRLLHLHVLRPGGCCVPTTWSRWRASSAATWGGSWSRRRSAAERATWSWWRSSTGSRGFGTTWTASWRRTAPPTSPSVSPRYTVEWQNQPRNVRCLTSWLCGVQDLVSSCRVPWTWRGPGFGSLTCGTTPSSPTCWRRCGRDCR